MRSLMLCCVLLLTSASAAGGQGFFGGMVDQHNKQRQLDLQSGQLALQQQQLRLQQAPYLMQLRDQEFEQEAKLWAGAVQQTRSLMGEEPLTPDQLVTRMEQLGAMLWETQYKQRLLK